MFEYIGMVEWFFGCGVRFWVEIVDYGVFVMCKGMFVFVVFDEIIC